MKLSLTIPLCLGLVTSTGCVFAQAGDLLACRRVSDATARLTCYDRVALPAGAPMAPGVPPPNTTATPIAPLGAPAATTDSAAGFGLPRIQGAPEQVLSRFSGLFEGWDPHSRVRLANGQVWQITDGSSAVYHLTNPKITVRRAMLGGYVMDVEGINQLPRVRRVE